MQRRFLRFQGILNFSGSLSALKGCHTIPLEGLSHKRGRQQQIKCSNQLWWDVELYEGGLSSRATYLKLSSRKLCLFMSLSARAAALRCAISLKVLKSLFKNLSTWSKKRQQVGALPSYTNFYSRNDKRICTSSKSGSNLQNCSFNLYIKMPL